VIAAAHAAARRRRPHVLHHGARVARGVAATVLRAAACNVHSASASCAAWYQDESTRPRPPGEAAYISNLRDGEPLVSPFNVRLAADGWGICANGVTAVKCGHFQLDVLRGGKLLQSTGLANGATQTNLFLPVGSYTLRTRFVDGATGRALLPAQDIETSVTASERF